MNIFANTTNANGQRGQYLSQRGNSNGLRVSSDNNQNTDRDRNEFIRSFQLNITTASSPILVRNDIRKLDDDCYGARKVTEYFRNSNPHKVNIHIKQIWKVHNVEHYAQFMQNSYNEVDNMLLWHGTSRQNLVSILQNNLKLPAQATHGHMFGPGIYFADRFLKSARYTDQRGPEVFLLCQVALGKKWRVYQAENRTSAPSGFHTLKAVGKYVPDIGGQKMLGQYCKIPCGRTVSHRDAQPSWALLFNEYIVFDQDRIRIKYIVHCERGGSGSSMTPAVLRRIPLQNPIGRKPVALRPIGPSRASTINNFGTGTNKNFLPSELFDMLSIILLIFFTYLLNSFLFGR